MKRQIEKTKSAIYQLLRLSEKYTKTDMVYLARGGFWVTLGQASIIFFSFILAVIFANRLPKETYGNYRYILSILSFLAITNLPGMSAAIVQSVARGFEGSVFRAVKARVRWGLIGTMAGVITSAYYFLNDNSNLGFSFLILSFFVPFFDSFFVYDSYLQGKKLFGRSTQYSLYSQLFSVTALSVSLFLTKNLILIVFVYIASITIGHFAAFKLALKKFPPNQKVDEQALSFGKHLSLMSVFSTIASYIDRVLIFHFLGGAQLAVYSFAIAPPEQLKAVIKGLKVLSLPKLSAKTANEIKGMIFNKTIRLAFFILIPVAFYIALAPLFFKIFFPQYLDSVIYSQIFALSIVTTVNLLPSSALQALAAKKQLYALNIIECAVQITLLFPLIFYFGVWGAIVSRVITRFLMLSVSLALVKTL